MSDDINPSEKTKVLTGDDVLVDVDLDPNIMVQKKKETIMGIPKPKKTFQSITKPLTGIIGELKSLITERAKSVKDKQYEKKQIDLAIEEDLNEIHESETTIEFIEQVIKGAKPKQ